MDIRRATDADWPRIWPIWHEVVAAGDTYVWAPDTGESAARALWMLPAPAEVWVALEEAPLPPAASVAEERGIAVKGPDSILGTAVLKPNQPGLGDHVANAGFMVDPAAAGRGVGRRLAEHVIRRAAAAGYAAIQFNAVVSTNTKAIGLWRSLGFDIVGTVPGAFRHAVHGAVDLHVMYRKL
jgi:ribosomal protein S18 acetylase RimI-like enzyme